ncbi:DUF2141 domain-containing protein [Stieleria varia]|uniref:DUF2141 domain-containing protein n=1 Tax=Stieleria varia TaxID=2528005 RepID=A0A5C6ARX4_9BACT|nr:DUF2141 domain-containing protein [Stieleria varia]TWU02735.1 hypothetical protein Pla52n_37940 [Stieleria varia]
MSDLDDSPPEIQTPTLWQQNHGNFLLFWVIAITLVGFIVLYARPDLPVEPPVDSTVELLEASDVGPSLVVRVTGKEDMPPGEVKIAIYDSAEAFRDPSKAYLKHSVPHENGIAVWLIPTEELPSSFGVAAYMDSDGDGELTKNQLGMPLEPFGFSRNARGLFGSPPEFGDTILNRPSETSQIEVLLR